MTDRRGRVRVSADLLKALLHLPDDARVDFVSFVPESRTVEIYLSGHGGLPVTHPGSHVTPVTPVHKLHPTLGVLFTGWNT